MLKKLLLVMEATMKLIFVDYLNVREANKSLQLICTDVI